MSMSYGITNFALIWIWLSKDKLIKEFTLLIWLWWICCPMITSTFANTQHLITIQRTTGSYHGYMALIMLISYVALIAHNMRYAKDRDKQFNILWLFAIGILVQLGWEAGLLIGGIRSAEFDTYTKVMTLITNSLVETNLGIPAIYLIYLKLTQKYREDLTRVNTPSLMQRLKESNSQRIFG